MTIAPDIVIKNQSIGDALEYADFEGVDGIIGVGPLDLTIGTLYPDINATIPTVMDNALQQGLIPTEILGVSFAPAIDYNDTSKRMKPGSCSQLTGALAFRRRAHVRWR